MAFSCCRIFQKPLFLCVALQGNKYRCRRRAAAAGEPSSTKATSIRFLIKGFFYVFRDRRLCISKFRQFYRSDPRGNVGFDWFGGRLFAASTLIKYNSSVTGAFSAHEKLKGLTRELTKCFLRLFRLGSPFSDGKVSGLSFRFPPFPYKNSIWPDIKFQKSRSDNLYCNGGRISNFRINRLKGVGRFSPSRSLGPNLWGHFAGGDSPQFLKKLIERGCTGSARFIRGSNPTHSRR